MQLVGAVLESLRQAGLTANPKNCVVERRKVRYLGAGRCGQRYKRPKWLQPAQYLSQKKRSGGFWAWLVTIGGPFQHFQS